ncbi:MAG: hypothetical protein PHF60_04165 [Candidatus ainarchaeum sp.]|nr:hypothetical protein [Candidatus ainarchaeum sp.]
MAFDLVTFVNMLLGVIILGTGYWSYKKSKDVVPLYIGLAFGIFAISHVITLAGMAESLSSALIVIRIIAYVLVLYALYVGMKRQPKGKSK